MENFLDSKITPVVRDKNEDTEDDSFEHSNDSKVSLGDRYSKLNVDDNEKVRIRTTTDLISLLVAEATGIEGKSLNYHKIAH